MGWRIVLDGSGSLLPVYIETILRAEAFPVALHGSDGIFVVDPVPGDSEQQCANGDMGWRAALSPLAVRAVEHGRQDIALGPNPLELLVELGGQVKLTKSSQEGERVQRAASNSTISRNQTLDASPEATSRVLSHICG